jgi:hypothetical protein
MSPRSRSVSGRQNRSSRLCDIRAHQPIRRALVVDCEARMGLYLRPAANGIEQKRSLGELFDWYIDKAENKNKGREAKTGLTRIIGKRQFVGH